jgi:alkanesulfonate monooxygenase SsuD/methylene tetrahydromethanopterin reductase-like flavin-dependent oxidoreductase (luciferase family)
MKFGVFDHVDDGGLLLAEHLEGRLQLAEAYDRLGMHCYHLAEHHGTRLALSPSPGVLFAAMSQCTTRLRFGPLVYLLPLYHLGRADCWRGHAALRPAVLAIC